MMADSAATARGDNELLFLFLPPAALALLFVGGFLFYLGLTSMQGKHDEEMRNRGASLLLGAFFRDFFVWLMSPALRFLLAGGISASAVTSLALLFSIGAGAALGYGHFALGGWLFLLSGFLDYLDGRVARASDNESPAGALLDSIFDRYAEGALFMGLAWFYRESWVLLVVLLAALGSQLISYARTRCADLGADVGRVGVLQRPERVTILGVSFCLSPLLQFIIAPEATQPIYHLAIAGMSVIAVLGNITTLQRLSAGIRLLNRKTASNVSES